MKGRRGKKDAAASATAAATVTAQGAAEAVTGSKVVGSRVHAELSRMMYGAGDAETPLPESVALMEAIVRRYMRDVTALALRRGRASLRDANDLLYVVRRDAKKYRRAKELLLRDEQLRRIRSRFSDKLESAFRGDRDEDEDVDGAAAMDGVVPALDGAADADADAYEELAALQQAPSTSPSVQQQQQPQISPYAAARSAAAAAAAKSDAAEEEEFEDDDEEDEDDDA